MAPAISFSMWRCAGDGGGLLHPRFKPLRVDMCNDRIGSDLRMEIRHQRLDLPRDFRARLDSDDGIQLAGGRNGFQDVPAGNLGSSVILDLIILAHRHKADVATRQ